MTSIAAKRHPGGTASRIVGRFAAMRRSVSAGGIFKAKAGSARPRSGRCGADRLSPEMAARSDRG